MTDTVNPELLEGLARMMSANAQRRADRANTAVATLRPFERRLVREAAVMGYVLGQREGMVKGRQGGSVIDDGDFPRDREILRWVIEHCDSTSDLYPYLAAACDGRRRRVTKARQWQGEGAA